MPNAAADDKTTVFQLLVDDLLRQELAALEVIGHLRRDAQQHLGLVPTEPDVIVVFDLPINVGAGREDVIGDYQLTDTAQREGFELPFIRCRQIPNALAVDEAIRLERAPLVSIGEDAALVIPDGLVELLELRVVGLQLLVVVPPHEEAALTEGIEQRHQESRTAVREKLIDPHELGEGFQILGAQLAPVFGNEPIAPVRRTLGDASEAVQVAVDRAFGHAELVREFLRTEGFVLVQLQQDAGQAVGQRVVLRLVHSRPTLDLAWE